MWKVFGLILLFFLSSSDTLLDPRQYHGHCNVSMACWVFVGRALLYLVHVAGPFRYVSVVLVCSCRLANRLGPNCLPARTAIVCWVFPF